MEQKRTITIIVGFCLVAGISYYVGSEHRENLRNGHDMHEMDQTDPLWDGPVSDQKYEDRDDQMGMGQMHDMMVESEKEFLQGMIPHHEEAVSTAKEVLERGGSTEAIRTLAQNIVTSQTAEIESMKSWYSAWYGEVYKDKGTYRHMMRDLSALSGSALDKIFLEDMIRHHAGAIMMAEMVEPHLEHAEIENLRKLIIENQTNEIQQMREMLTEM